MLVLFKNASFFVVVADAEVLEAGVGAAVVLAANGALVLLGCGSG